MTPNKQELQEMIRTDANSLAARILDILPIDKDCQAAFDKWRAVQKRIFDNPEPSSRETYKEESEAFQVLMLSLGIADEIPPL